MEGKKIEPGKHSCSNPDCGKIFSRPKVIKYYVCPSCQTLIDIPTQKIPDNVTSNKKTVERARKKESESELTLNQLVSNDEVTQSKENAKNEAIDLELEFIAESESIDTSSLEQKVQLAVEGRKVLSELNFQCSHYFGFLSEKKEGQEIPETCFECPKSVECLLSRCTKSEESIQEIKQWYIPNNQ
jgi:hypothetical protein